MNSKMRNLIQQLGEAIHETVSDSEHIASVVRNIRAEGFDVLLMLEATIGLNEVTEDPAEPVAAQEAGENTAGTGPFTAQDVHFLQALRIRMDPDANGEDASAEGPIPGPR